LEAIDNFYNKWGLSNFLLIKLCHVVKNSLLSSDFIHSYENFTRKISIRDRHHDLIKLIELSTTETILFDSYTHHLSNIEGVDNANFRRDLILHISVCVPIGSNDISHYIQRAHSSSYIDEIIALIVLFNISSENEYLKSLFDRFIDQDLESQLNAFYTSSESTINQIYIKSRNSDRVFYNYSFSFLELKPCAAYRCKIDEIIIPRLSAQALDLRPRDSLLSNRQKIDRKSLSYTIRKPNFPRIAIDPIEDGVLTKTARFLAYLDKYPNSLDFSEGEIRKIFDNTCALPYLMTVEEIINIYESAISENKYIITTLAIALLKQKVRSDDIEFTFARNLEIAVQQYFNSDLVSFIEWISEKTISVAKYIVDNLDTHMLEKLYLLMESQEQVNRTRTLLLQKMSDLTGEIAYFELARRANIDEKVGSLRRRMDQSRVYVDHISFYIWLQEKILNSLSTYMTLTRTHYEKTRSELEGHITDQKIDSALKLNDEISKYDHLIVTMLEESYKSFCLDPHFGIDSYIGRRIRHNTLKGVMKSTIDNVFKNKNYRTLHQDVDFNSRKKLWLERYLFIIDDLRINKLHFKDKIHRAGFFEIQGFNKDRIEESVARLKYYVFNRLSIDICAEEIIDLCWRIIEPQLTAFRVYMTVELKSLIFQSIDEEFTGNSVAENNLRGELKEQINETFNKVASWFRIPDQEAPSSSIRALAQLVYSNCQDSYSEFDSEMVLLGNCADVTVDTPTIHYLYDCLDIVMENIADYGRPQSQFSIGFDLRDNEGKAIEAMLVRVESVIRDGPQGERDFERLKRQCSTTEELSAAMVREGLSGIQKLRYLLSKLDPDTSLVPKRQGNMLRLEFSLPIGIVEYASSSDSGG
jgi:hypothetical protein